MGSPPRGLLETIRSQAGGRPVVSLEAFFEGNDDTASIGCNLSPHPGVATFYAMLREIRARDDVADVLVGISEDMGDDEWPFADSVYVLTRAAPGDVESWAAELQPDPDSREGYFPQPFSAASAPAAGFHVVTLWWD